MIEGISAGEILELLDGPTPQEGLDALDRLLRDLGPLINPELFELLANSPDPVFHATDIIEGLQKGLQFIVDDPKVFLRTSVIDFDAFATLFGVYGSFYAGYGPADRAGVAAGSTPAPSPALASPGSRSPRFPAPRAARCGETFGDLFNAYREAIATDGGPNRADDPVGELPAGFGVTGVLTGDAIAAMGGGPSRLDRRRSHPASNPTSPTSASATGARSASFDAWSDDSIAATTTSISRAVRAARPGQLARGALVVAGRARLQPCGPAEQRRRLGRRLGRSAPRHPARGARRPVTIAINRLGGVGGFTESVTRLLNASDDDVAALYSTTDPASSFYVGLVRGDRRVVHRLGRPGRRSRTCSSTTPTTRR